jgi:hypothetical protein
MDALIRYLPDPFKAHAYEQRTAPAGLPILDAIRATFPDLIDVPLIVIRNGIRAQGDEILDEGDVVTVASRPEAIGWAAVAKYVVQALIAAAVSYLVGYLFKPKNKTDKGRSPAYSVDIQQNAARLGQTIPVIYGRVKAMPDIAAQPYSEFLAHNERISMILCLGMGEYQINDIHIGESRVTDFPPGNIQTWIFKPADHKQRLGVIESITGICEDMLTIPETSGVDLAAPNDPPEVSVAGTVSGGVLTPTNPQEAQLWTGLVPGKQYVVTNSVGGSVVVRYVGQGPNNSAVFDGPLPPPPAVTWISSPLQLTPVDDAQEGRMMLLYTQNEMPALGLEEIVYVDNFPFTKRFGPFQIARKEVRDTRMYMRLSGPGFTSATGEEPLHPMQNGAVVRNAFVTYYVSEYVPGTDPGEPYRWRGWYATARPGYAVDMIYVDIVMPNGIAWVTDKGDYKNMTTTFYVDIQQIDNNNAAIGGLRRETIRITGATSTARRLTYKYAVGAGRYRVRIGRVNARDQRASKEISAAQLYSIRCRIHHTGEAAYENCTLIAMQFVASAGLNAASNRRITVDCTRMLNPWFTMPLLATVNPAHAVLDAYTNTDYGGARPPSEVDVEQFSWLNVQWETTAGFNGVFDQPTTLIEAMQAMLAPVRAMPLPIGKRLSVTQDAPRAREFVFGDDTVVKESVSIGYNFDGEDVADCLEITFTDPVTFVERRTYYPSQGVRPDPIELFGCTSEAQAQAWAKCAWQDRQLNRKTCEFELEGEGYLLQPLSRFGLAVPILNWGTTGRVMQFNPSTLALTIDTPFPQGVTQISFKDYNGKLTTPVNVAQVVTPYDLVLASAPPADVHAADQTRDGSTWAAGQIGHQYFEFSVINLASSGFMRVRVTGKQYTDAAYSGTFVENWRT